MQSLIDNGAVVSGNKIFKKNIIVFSFSSYYSPLWKSVVLDLNKFEIS
jgi:hypothetical protein